MIANRRMAVSERSAVGRAIAVGYVAGSIPAVPMVGIFYAKWGVSMYLEFVYVGYSTKQCVEFIDGIEEKLKAHDKNFEYDKEHLVIKAELFKCSALPIYSGCLSCLGMENAEYICKETVRPKNYFPSPEECLKIKAILKYVSARFRKTPKEKTEKELVELIDTLIEV